MYKIYLFGTPRIENDGVIINIPRRKSIALLAYLVVTQQPYQRDKLASLLYPDYDQARSRTNLRRDIFDLKSALAGQILLREREVIGLQPAETYWVDVNEFLNHVQHIRQHHQQSINGSPTSLCADCQTRLSDAVQLYSDDFMAGFTIPGSREFEEWQYFQYEQLHQKLAEMLERLVEWHSERGEFVHALSYARLWLSMDDLNESAQRQIMRLNAWSGQPEAALRQYTEYKRRLSQELGTEPDVQMIDLYEAIRHHKLESPQQAAELTTGLSQAKNLPRQPQNNLPIPDGQLIGRDKDLEQAVNRLRDDSNCRILTILGPGGIGKTRLAIETALRLAEDKACPFCEGIYYVPLAASTQPEAIIMEIASVLKLPLVAEPDQRTKQVLNYLQAKRLLLLLDNFEQLIGPQTIQLLISILNQAPSVKLLITSRAHLNIHNEYLLPLQGLDIPAIQSGKEGISVKTIGEYGAIRLFLDRALVQIPDYSLRPDDITPIVQICQMVEGMPLGIELAATWLDVLPPSEILQEIKRTLDFLTTTWPDRPEKHHSLRAVFDSSWNLLTEQERSALMRLTVFQGSFSRQSAQAVSGASTEILQSLKNKSWLKSVNDRTFQIHDLLCQYASEKLLSDSTAWLQTKQRYMEYYSTQLDQHWVNIKGPKQREVIDWISSEFENIRLAWQWLIEGGQEELAIHHLLPVLYRYSETRAKPFELIQLIDFAIGSVASVTTDSSPTLLNSTLLVAKAAYNDSGAPLRMSETLYLNTQREFIRRSWKVIGDLEILKRIDFWGLVATFLYGLLIDTPVAIRYLQELVAHYRTENQRWNLAYALSLLGSIQVRYTFSSELTPLPEGAEPILNEARSIFTELGDISETSYVIEMIGRLHYLIGKYSTGKYYEAIDNLQAAVVFQEQVGEYVHYASIMAVLALCYMNLGDHQSVLGCYQQTSLKLQTEGHFSGAATALHLESLYSTRYVDCAHALPIRQQSIALYQKDGNEVGVAWGTWEMGEIYRLSGDLIQTHEWFNRARSLFNQLGEKPGHTFLSRSDGDLAIMANDWPAAKIHYERSAELAREMNQVWALAYALCGLAKAEDRLGDSIDAIQHINQAIQIAWKFDRHELTLYTLAGYTQLLISSGEAELATELGTWIVNHTLTWNETREQVKSMLNSISLPPDLLETAVEHSKFLDFNVVIARIENIPPKQIK